MPLPKIAVIREGKVPPDSRVPLTPQQVAQLQADGVDIQVQQSNGRIFKDVDYAELGVPPVGFISDAELLLGVKEVPIEQLIEGKTYCFFAHVAKQQPYNQKLMRALLDRRITMIDYEYLTDEQGKRLIAFGYWAGMVGAHNTIWTYGQRTGQFALPRLKELYDYEEARRVYERTDLPPMRVVLTGTGRVGKGAAAVLRDMGFQELEPKDFLAGTGRTVFTVLSVKDYARRPDGGAFTKKDFYANAAEFESAFAPYARVSDVFINGIFWDGVAPAFFTAEDMQSQEFNIKVIGDVTCDIAPAASVPSTLFATTIAEPVFGYDPNTKSATEPYQDHTIDVMSIDNLPSELPRDASRAFGHTLIEKILPEFGKEHSDILERATITRNGELGPHFQHLSQYAEGRPL